MEEPVKRKPGRPRLEGGNDFPIPDTPYTESNGKLGIAPVMVPDEKRREAFVLAFWELGNRAAAARRAQISVDTAQDWANSAWFKPRLEEVKRQANRTLEQKLTRLTDKALKALEDRIDNGDHKLVQRKVGKDETPPPPEMMRIPLTAQTLTIAAGVLLDKRALIKKEEDNGTSPVEDAFDRLAAKLRQFAPPGTPPLQPVEDVQSRDVVERQVAKIIQDNADLE